MLRIGMVGSESFHALAFAKLANLDAPADCPARITHIWGEAPDRTSLVARQACIPHIVSSPAAMLGQVDAVMIVLRKGSTHLETALPFLKAGIPAWVDKPLTDSLQTTRLLVDAARQNGVLLDGGSACRYGQDVLALQQAFAEMRKKNEFISAHLNFPGEIDSPYDGLYFYGAHTAQLLLSVFGAPPQSVSADVNDGNVIGLFRYADFSVTVNFAEVSSFFCTLYSKQSVVTLPIDISQIYRPAFQAFISRIQGRMQPLPHREFLQNAAILDALVAASRDGASHSVAAL